MSDARYSIGTGGEDEPGLILIADSKTHMLIARSSTSAIPHVQEMIDLANENSTLKEVISELQAEIDSLNNTAWLKSE